MTRATLMFRFFERFGPRDAAIPWLLVVFVHTRGNVFMQKHILASFAVLVIKKCLNNNGNTLVLTIFACSISLMCNSLCFMQTFEFSRV